MREYSAEGYLELHKSGMQLTGSKSSVFDWNGKEYTLRQPVWDVLGLADASYGIYAAEDIVTPDGTVQYHAGDKVAQLTTKKTGSQFPSRWILENITV